MYCMHIRHENTSTDTADGRHFETKMATILYVLLAICLVYLYEYLGSFCDILTSVYYIWLCSIKTVILKNKMAAIQISLLAIFRVNMRICVVIVIFWLWVVCADSYIPLTLQSIYEEAHFEIQNGCHIKFLIGNILGVHVKSCSFRDILTSS